MRTINKSNVVILDYTVRNMGSQVERDETGKLWYHHKDRMSDLYFPVIEWGSVQDYRNVSCTIFDNKNGLAYRYDNKQVSIISSKIHSQEK